MTQQYTNTSTLQQYSMAAATAQDNAFAQTQSANQKLAEQLGNFTLFDSKGQVDGARTNAAQNDVRNTVVYLTAAVIATAVVNPLIFTTSMIDWSATLTARQAFRTANYGF
jgi:hypothetical protein